MEILRVGSLSFLCTDSVSLSREGGQARKCISECTCNCIALHLNNGRSTMSAFYLVIVRCPVVASRRGSKIVSRDRIGGGSKGHQKGEGVQWRVSVPYRPMVWAGYLLFSEFILSGFCCFTHSHRCNTWRWFWFHFSYEISWLFRSFVRSQPTKF